MAIYLPDSVLQTYQGETDSPLSQLANYAHGGLWGSGKWFTQTERNYSQYLLWKASGSQLSAMCFHLLLFHDTRLHINGYTCTATLGRLLFRPMWHYFFSHSGPLNFFTLRLTSEANFALLLMKKPVWVKWILKNCDHQSTQGKQNPLQVTQR